MTGRSIRLQERDSLMAGMVAQGLTAAQISQATGCNLATVYQWARENKSPLKSGTQQRNERIADLAVQGKTSNEIAAETGASQGSVLSWARDHGVKLAKKPRAAPETQMRAERMAAMYKQGITLVKIGAEFGITRERVRQIIAKQGLTAQHGGASKASAVRRAASLGKKEAECIVKFGFPLDVIRQLRKEGVLHAFSQQKRNAGFRAVAWDLSFAEWFAIWQASGKLHLRGRGKGKYVMSRMRDDGPYAVGNVHIQLAEQNSRDAVKTWSGRVKENRGVFCMYPGRRNAWWAKVGKVSLGYFETEREAVDARAAYLAKNPSSLEKSRGRGYAICTEKSGRVRYQVMVSSVYVGMYHTPEAALAARAEYLAARLPVTATEGA